MKDSCLLSQLAYEAVIGEGGFGIVQRYRHRKSGTCYAVKKLRSTTPADIKRFSREIDLMHELQPHQHIVEILGQGDHKGTPYFVMPLADTNLERFLELRNSALDTGTRLDIIHAICSAITHAHERGVLHRDLAPSNVLLYSPATSLQVRVGDFGLGRYLDASTSNSGSRTGGLGHVEYTAPEQRLSLGKATTRSDVYSLGRLIKFVVTGQRPDSIVTSAFDHVIATATAHDPSRRYSSASALHEAFTELATLSQHHPDTIELNSLSRHSDSLPWADFHRLSTHSDYVGHVYYEYLEPVTDYLSHRGRLERYVTTIGVDIQSFAQRYMSELRLCVARTGWPFSAMNWLGAFLQQLFLVSTDTAVRKHALDGLWLLAYEHDQWKVQDLVLHILHSGAIAGELDQAVALMVKDRGFRAENSALSPSRLPPLTRTAIARYSEAPS